MPHRYPRAKDPVYRMPYQPAGRVDARAPQAKANDLSLSPAHDFTAFDKAFPRPSYNPSAPATAPAAAKPATGPSTVLAAPKNIQGNVVQGLLDRAAGVTSPPAATPPNPGAVARATGQQQQTPYGTVGTGKQAQPDGTPIMENGKEVGIAGNPQQGPPAPTLAETRATTVNKYPAIGVAGTPENLAFIAAANQGGEAAAHQNLDNLMKPFAVGPPMPTESDKALQEYTERKMQPGLLPGAPKPGKAIAAAARTAAENASENPPPPDPADSLSGYGAMKGLLAAAGRATMPGGNAATTPPDFPPAGQPGGRIGGTGGVTSPLPTPAPARSSYVPDAPAPAPAPAPTTASNSEDTVPDLQKVAPPLNSAGPVPYKPDPVTGKRRAILPATTPDAPTASTTSASEEREDQVPNLANGYTPQGGGWGSTPESGTMQAGDAAFRSNMQAGQTALRNDQAAAGFPGQPTTTQTLSGHPEDTVFGATGQDWNELPNYAAGYVPSYAQGSPAMRKAITRERTAIQHHVGGARRGDQPEPVLLAGKPAVINTGERLARTPNGPAVLNRKMQQRQGYTPAR